MVVCLLACAFLSRSAGLCQVCVRLCNYVLVLAFMGFHVVVFLNLQLYDEKIKCA